MPTPVMVNSRSPIPVQASRMGMLEDRLADISKQIATGERFSRPSDDPSAANRAAMLERLEQRLISNQRSIERATSRLSLAETASVSAGDALVRARELAISAANGTITASDRKVILREVEVLQNQLLEAANSRDEAGQYVFAGSSSGSPAFQPDIDGVIRWQGLGHSAGAEAAGIDGASTPPGPALFGTDADGAFASLQKLADGLAEEDDALRNASFQEALDGLIAAYDQLLDGRARIGAGLARLDVENSRIETAKLNTQEAMAGTKGLDLEAAVIQLEALKLTLSASQGVFTRIFDGTLFDQLR